MQVLLYIYNIMHKCYMRCVVFYINSLPLEAFDLNLESISKNKISLCFKCFIYEAKAVCLFSVQITMILLSQNMKDTYQLDQANSNSYIFTKLQIHKSV